MSNSDHEWLGRIPSHWELRPLQYCLMECKERNGPEPVGEMLSVSGYTGVSVKEYEHEAQKRSLEDLEDYRVVRPGQLVVNTMWLNHRGLGVSPHVGYVSPAYSVYSVGSDLDERFIHYLMRSNRYVDRYKSLLYGIRPNSLQIKSYDWDSIPLLIPPLDDQRAVANFLDRETSRIDKLIDRKKRLIELLEEMRTALITRAVTKGLDPDVPMKDSGVEWLGEIPEHWEVRQLRHMASFQSGSAITSSDIHEDGTYPVYGGNGLRGFTDSFTHEGVFPLIGRQGALAGNVNYAEGKFWASEHAVVVTPRRETHSWWIGRLITAMNLNLYADAAAQPGLAVSEVIGLKGPFPPIPDQKRIARHIEEESESIDRLARQVERGMSLLEEYRSALISAAVTGKVDVREQAA